MWVLLLHPLTLLYDGALYNAMQFTLCTAVVHLLMPSVCWRSTLTVSQYVWSRFSTGSLFLVCWHCDDIAALITLITCSISPLWPRTNVLENTDTRTAGHKHAGGTQTPLITAAISSQSEALASLWLGIILCRGSGSPKQRLVAAAVFCLQRRASNCFVK